MRAKSLIAEKAKGQAQSPLDPVSAIASAAFARLRDEGVPALPNHYAVVYAFYERTNTDLLKQFNEEIEREGRLTADICARLFEKYLRDDKRAETVEGVSVAVEEVLGEVLQIFENAGVSTERYGRVLAAASQGLSPDVPAQHLRSLIEEVRRETARVTAENGKLQEELQVTSNRMAQLRTDLERVKIESQTDALTGVPNRKALETGLRRLTNISETHGAALTLLIADIDHFKSFNDTHGHQTGDMVLKLVARTLQSNIRDTDLIARYGGEEFVILLPDTSVDAGLQVAEKLNALMGQKELRSRKTGQSLGSVTVSIGVTEFQPGEPLDEFVDRADAALYDAKQAGRDRVCVR